MNKAELIDAIAGNSGLSKADAKKAKSFLESGFFKEKGFLKDSYDPLEEFNSYKDNGLFFNNMFGK